MFDRIVYIGDRTCNVKLKEDCDVTFNLMNLHVIFEDDDKKLLGEVDDIDQDIVKVRLLGEITKRGLLGGVIRKPTLDASIRVITPDEVPLVTGRDRRGYMLLGESPFYNGKDVYMDVNGFFSNHFAIFGNSGSGKSCGVSRIFQNMFLDERLFPYKSNIIMFDSSGEYYNAFKNLSTINPNYNYRFISTNETDGLGEALRLPIYLLNVDDLALLLNVTNHSQLPIIERMLKLARIFSEDGVDANSYKNHLIAKAIMTILYTNETSPNKRNEIFSILASCSTPEFSLETEVKGIGYTRKFRDCFLIDQFGNFTESVLVTEYISSFIKEEYDSYEPAGNVFYNLDTLEKALNFTLISEGWLRNENTYGDSVTIKVRLHSLITGNNAKYFDFKEYVTLEQFISSLLIVNGRKSQIVNINLDDVDDVFAKVIVKIYSRLVFVFSKSLQMRASIPFHLIVEEAHRYIQNDTDTFLIGYNIFDRIAKEGRKYGVILGLITQRPVEMSDTVISQCSNFLIFKMNHPADVEYIRKMVPNISEEIVEKQKSLQAGTCLAFGQAFKIPLIVKLQMPNPEPRSGNCDVVTIWDGNDGNNASSEEESDEEFVKQIEEKAKVTLMEEEKKKTISNNTKIDDMPKAIPEMDTQVVEEAINSHSIITSPVVNDNVSLAKEENLDNIQNSNNMDENKSIITSPIVNDNVSLTKEENSDNIQNSNNMGENQSIITSPIVNDNVSLTKEENFDNIPNNANQVENNLNTTTNLVNDNNVSDSIINNVAMDTSNIVANSQSLSSEDLSLSPKQIADVTDNSLDSILGLNKQQEDVNQHSIIPDVDVFVPTMTPPVNSTNVDISAQFTNNSNVLSPDVKQEEIKPAIIIPGGQNVSSTLMNGFDGQAVVQNNTNE